MKPALCLLALPLLALSCNEPPAQEPPAFPTTGSVERLDPALDAIVAPGANIEVLADSFIWSEGPVWIGGSEDGFVAFSDVPANEIFRWSEKDGLSSYLKPSGYTGPDRPESQEGSNGLLLDAEGRLVLCQHGDRRMARMTAPATAPAPTFETLADTFDGKRFSSPNDACYDAQGNLYFTDPPYGLPLGPDDTVNREISFCGVYRLAQDGSVTLIDSTMTKPNGIALSPNGQTLYVANSDPDAPMLKAFARQADGTFGEGAMFFDAKALEGKGLPDGLRVLSDGHLVATGPGGVLVISPEGRLLGRILTGEATANCTVGADGNLYMTAHMFLMRIRLSKS